MVGTNLTVQPILFDAQEILQAKNALKSAFYYSLLSLKKKEWKESFIFYIIETFTEIKNKQAISNKKGS